MFDDQMTLFNSQIVVLRIDEIKTNKNQPRKYFNPSRLEELAESIRQHGIIQPLVVRQEQKYILLVAGERRLRAAEIAGLKEVPVYFIEGDTQELALIENIQREDLNPIEEAEAVHYIQQAKSYKQDQLASILGKKQNTVSEILTLVKLPEKIRNECRKDARWSRSQLLRIARLKSDDEMLDEFEKVKSRLSGGNGHIKIVKASTKYTKAANAAIKRISLLKKNIGKLDLEKIEQKQKSEMKSGLVELKKQIEEIVARF